MKLPPPDELQRRIDRLPPSQRAEVYGLLATVRPSKHLKSAGHALTHYVPSYSYPTHLQRYIDLLDRSVKQPMRIVAHAPPRHGKTQLMLAHLLRVLEKDPTKTVAYVSYEAHVAQEKSRQARDWATERGIPLRPDAQRLGYWRTPQGGGFLAIGVGGGLTGIGVDCLVGSTPVTTRQHGVVEIQDLSKFTGRVDVLAYDHRTNQPCWSRITTIMRRASPNGLVNVRTSGGTQVTCTPEHLFYVEGSGYREAALLRSGDRIVRSPPPTSLLSVRFTGQKQEDEDLRPVFRDTANDYDGASHRSRCPQQPPAQSHLGLQELSCGTPQEHPDSVSVVQRHCDGTHIVYDLTVEDTHNFFAGGVLVHNCLGADDPYKSRVQAESAAYHKFLTGWMDDVATTRIEPGGSIVIAHTRWTTRDLIAHVTSRSKWDSVVLPAVNDQNQPLWAERYDLQALNDIRTAVGEYTWASLYQGQPRPRGTTLFDVDLAPRYQSLPTTPLTYAVGVDFAYSAKSTADYTVAVVLAKDHLGTIYLIDSIRLQERPEVAATLVQRFADANAPRGTPIRWIASGMEAAAATGIRQILPTLQTVTAIADKWIRAQPIAAQWAAGKVAVPHTPSSDLDATLSSLSLFSGVHNQQDDDADALSAAYALISNTHVAAPPHHPGTLDAHQASMDAYEAQLEAETQEEVQEQWAGW